ncbi:TetR/AcrR family transcriptional regulator [Phytoactinopolyspora halotolerans]|uniref:TetR/AcrR family transcriptional regulator n=1 Tax=Phytoactinopolyspora halotolerans TaxID=1981512 RepID=A0A6L9SGT2_9ACTN|nr:TetR/AcrR family transcriptional regulator [Phytoactinopolyspora halotolerans]NEE03808.1 TetR/AcrR family transcriptional regulator [Phytoactinopolyspora halotolerans]
MQTATTRRLPRAERREQILAAATTAFARRGFAATGLDDIATEAGVTRVILYRHFESKSDLYRGVLDRACTRLATAVGEEPGTYTDAAIDALISYAGDDPDGFRLLFRHAAREPEFRAQMETFRNAMTEAARLQITELVGETSWAAWASQLAPVVAVEAILAWLDAGRPDPGDAPDHVRRAIAGVIDAASVSPS